MMKIICPIGIHLVKEHSLHIPPSKKHPDKISAYHEIFMRWEKLMKGEKYVCLAGQFINHEEKANDGVKIEENYWIYDKVQTKKGFNSYFVEH